MCLFDVFSKIGFLLRTTYLCDASLIKTLKIVRADVVLLNRLITCFWILISSAAWLVLDWFLFVWSFMYLWSFYAYWLFTNGLKVRQYFTYVIWFSCVWVIWKERNNIIFSQTEVSIRHILDRVKLLSYWWLKAKYVNLTFGYHWWWLSPVCHSIWCIEENHRSLTNRPQTNQKRYKKKNIVSQCLNKRKAFYCENN